MLIKFTQTDVRTSGPHSTVQNAALWRNLRKTLINIAFPQNSGNFKDSSANISSPTDKRGINRRGSVPKSTLLTKKKIITFVREG